MSSKYTSDQVQRTLKALRAMVGFETQGISPSELAKRIDEKPGANITRILANLEEAGLAEKLPANDKVWRLTAVFAQASNTIAINLREAEQRIQQDVHNFSRLG